MMTTISRSLARVAAAAVLAVGLGSTVAACAHPSPPVGLSDCYQSLPIAEAALNLPAHRVRLPRGHPGPAPGHGAPSQSACP